MPLLDTRQSGDNLDKRFIADLVLQILSYVAQKELENTRCRQKQGMDVMPVINGKKTSLKTGRPNAQFPDNWKDYYEKWNASNGSNSSSGSTDSTTGSTDSTDDKKDSTDSTDKSEAAGSEE